MQVAIIGHRIGAHLGWAACIAESEGRVTAGVTAAGLKADARASARAQVHLRGKRFMEAQDRLVRVVRVATRQL